MKALLDSINKLVNIKPIDENYEYFLINGDTSKNLGCLHFTHEWKITAKLLENNSIELISGFEISSDNLEFSKGGEAFF